jgi:tetratricopeptide (TPR) repeat protein
MEALRLAVKDRRYIEARVSGNLGYSKYSTTRGGNRDDGDLLFSNALAKLKSAESASSQATDRLALARVYLSRGGRDDARKALAILNQLATGGFETPEALNDAGVAHLQLDEYDQAISSFNRALAKSPGYGEARFNMALAVERAHRYDEAKQEWQRYIDQAPDDGWKSEAIAYLNSLGGPGNR